MGLYFEERKKKDQGLVSGILLICAILALVAWVISKLYTLIKDRGSIFSVLVLGVVAAMIIWSISKWSFQDSEENIKFQGIGWTVDERGILSNWLEGLDENSLLFKKKNSIAMVVGAVVGWTMLKLFGGMFRGATFIALVVGLVAAVVLSKWLGSLEESKRKNRYGSVMTTFLAAGATVGAVAGLAALAGWGISQSFGSGSEPGESSKDKEKMMKAPGRDYYMPRKDFEGNPSAYFRHLRGKNY